MADNTNQFNVVPANRISSFYMGNSMVSKSILSLDQSVEAVPRTEEGHDDCAEEILDELLDKHNTLMPHSHGKVGGVNVPHQIEPDVHSKPQIHKAHPMAEQMHRHQGHPDSHPVMLRHRKVSADPMHKEEDGLIDEWKDLYDKAAKGECTAMELARINEIRGRIDEINASRSSDAQAILGIAFKSLDRAKITLSNSSIISLADSIARVVVDGTSDDESDGPEMKLKREDDYEVKDNGYGEPKETDVIPENDGFKSTQGETDKVTPKYEYKNRPEVHIAFPDKILPAPEMSKAVKSAFDLSENISAMMQSFWGQEIAMSIEKDYTGDKQRMYFEDEQEPYSDQTPGEMKGLNYAGDDGGLDNAEDGPSPEKAKEILHDNSANGHPLTDKQRRFMGWKAGQENNAELLEDQGSGEKGRGWGVRQNEQTGNFVAYQDPRGDMAKRDAQTEAVKRNVGEQGKAPGTRGFHQEVSEAMPMPNPRPLLREPRMRP